MPQGMTWEDDIMMPIQGINHCLYLRFPHQTDKSPTCLEPKGHNLCMFLPLFYHVSAPTWQTHKSMAGAKTLKVGHYPS